jgi:serine/threonine protein kinase
MDETGSSYRELTCGRELGRYRLDAPLGNSGALWAATDLALGRGVTVEVVRAPDAVARKQLARDACTLARVHHRCVIAVYDVVAIGEFDVIVMEPIDGETATAWLRRDRPTWQEVVSTLLVAAGGLAAAHAGGLVHGAFRPEHVLISCDDRVVLTGFGLARATRGSAAYMPPEQLAGGAIGPAADQFALCATLWEALSGTRPFSGTSLEQIVRAIRDGRPDARGIPRGLRDPLRRGLAFGSSDRWPSIDALVAALRAGIRTRRAAVIGGAALSSGGVIGLVLAFGLAARSGPPRHLHRPLDSPASTRIGYAQQHSYPPSRGYAAELGRHPEPNNSVPMATEP